MPPHRRSQGDGPSTIVSQLIKRASKRKPKPIARVRDARNLNEPNIELNIEPNVGIEEKKTPPIIRRPSTKKDLLSDTRIRSTTGVVVDASFHGNSVESRRAITKHTARQAREAIVVDRLRRKKIVQEATWKKECKLYDEKRI